MRQLPAVIEAMAIREIQAAIAAAERQGIVYGQKMVVQSASGSRWELIFEAAGQSGPLPKLFHMMRVQ